MNEIVTVLPEATMAGLACLVLLVEVFRGADNRAATFWAAAMSVMVVLAELAMWFPQSTTLAFHGTYRVDIMAAVLKAFLMVIVLLSFFYARDYFERRGREVQEFYILGLFATLGMMVLISAHNLLTVYLGLELLSLAMYAMVAMDRDSASASEAAMKYFVLGALASGMLLYGMSMIYGVSGTLDLGTLATQVAGGNSHLLYTFGLVFVLIGIAFKLGVVPFHMWVPDVYQGAPTPVTLFIGSAPKLAAFAMAVRVLTDGLGGLVGEWQTMLVLLSVASMAVGNVVAIAQTNLKRMLAYSTISHMGFLLLGLLSARTSGYAASMFYVITYAVMSMGAFGAIVLLSSANSESDRLQDFAGLAKRSPWLAFLMLIVIFSLAGVPPFAGFWAKWFVLKEVVAAGYSWLAIVAVVFSLIGAYYYLRIIKLMYFDAPDAAAEPISAGDDVRLVFSVNSLSILLLGLLPGTLMSVCLAAMLAYAS
ncbi:MAG: NADH-quinone oxidoreductase subunit NuoN [Proteobacteria bacterium]|jgi:NADH-quinone oxidoreductase subunit N|nr:NADH-quinone oxidoreductase subunit NuoN [Pseudomonadota bacterium]